MGWLAGYRYATPTTEYSTVQYSTILVFVLGGMMGATTLVNTLGGWKAMDVLLQSFQLFCKKREEDSGAPRNGGRYDVLPLRG